ncbi:MAG: hypothetical protein IPG02_17640 [Ignavibacteria bacterium]|nr:hypothetical protein [Ignavibacteria bacterium]
MDQIKNAWQVVWKVGLVAEYKMKTLNLLQDVDSAPGMFLRVSSESCRTILKIRRCQGYF